MFPPQPMEAAHFWYYMLELGFYGSLLLRISVDIKRKVRTSALMLHTHLLTREFHNIVVPLA